MALDNKPIIAWLRRQQATDGSFSGQASLSLQPFSVSRDHPTNFFTALILACLVDAKDINSIVKPAVAYLQKQVSQNGSWNYWRAGSQLGHDYPYPDDLDDTACALYALSLHDPISVGASQLASFAKLLIRSEIKPGGPYRTWLVVPELYEQWGDVDLVVNANIGNLLSSHDVQLAGLEAYIDQQLRRHHLISPYYVGHQPIIYFLSRWYHGAKVSRLRTIIKADLDRFDQLNSLQLALTISSAYRLKFHPKQLVLAGGRLQAMCQIDHWPAEALYVDPVIAGQQYYAGSAALTTAFALEALQLLSRTNSVSTVTTATHNDRSAGQQTVAAATDHSKQLPTRFGVAYRQAIKRIAGRDSDQQITAIASHTAAAYQLDINSQQLLAANLASLHGWIAYDIYDDFLDDEGRPVDISVANHALQQTVRQYQQALPHNDNFQTLVDDSLSIIDAANYWEVSQARADVQTNQLSYRLPNYGNYGQLANRSWGHMVAACASLVIAGYALNSSQVKQLQLFFRHYLIARQLNDDAHDWQDDLLAGHLSVVVCLLLKPYGNSGVIQLDKQLPALQQQFWQQTIYQISRRVRRHLRLAEEALNNCGMVNTSYFKQWLQTLEHATNRAIDGSQTTQQFIDAFVKS